MKCNTKYSTKDIGTHCTDQEILDKIVVRMAWNTKHSTNIVVRMVWNTKYLTKIV